MGLARSNRFSMATVFINYADKEFLRAQMLGVTAAREIGGFDRAFPMGRRNLDAQFAARNQAILNEPRGAGYWLWKPYIVQLALNEATADDDVLFYADAGCHFVANAAPVIALCREQPADKAMLLFTLEPHHTNRIWTKRDCFHYMGLDAAPYADATQTAGTFLVCRKTDAARAFVAEWLAYAEDRRILTDAPNECGLPDYPEFQAHRHDQSILSLLAVKHGIATVPDISQWGNGRRPAAIPQLVAHTRWRA
jgi:hypothetical protein